MLITLICCVLAARNADEREQWVRALEETILRHSQPTTVGTFSKHFVFSYIHSKIVPQHEQMRLMLCGDQIEILLKKFSTGVYNHYIMPPKS